MFLEKLLSSFPFTAQYTLKDKVLECHLIDNDFQEEYELVDLKGASGYASLVKEEYEAFIRAILSSCTIKKKESERPDYWIYSESLSGWNGAPLAKVPHGCYYPEKGE